VRMEWMVAAGSWPIRSVSSDLSMVRIWETLTALGLGRFAAPFSIILAIELWRAALGLGVILVGLCRRLGLACLSGCRRRRLVRCRLLRGDRVIC
jgi:hypothetical protein